MSSPKAKDQTIVEIERKPARDTERCGIGRASRLTSHARSPSISGQRSKIPTTIGHAIRPGLPTQSHDHQENPRNLTSVASDDMAIGKSSPMNSVRCPTSKSLTAASGSLATSKTNKSSNSSVGNSAMLKRNLENQFATKKKRYVSIKKELTEKQKNAANLYDELLQLREKLMSSGAKDPGKIDTINLTSVPIKNSSINCPIDSQAFRGSGEHIFSTNLSLTNELVSSTMSKIRDLPKRRVEMCDEIMRKHLEIIEFFVNHESLRDETELETKYAQELETRKNESLILQSRLEELKKYEETSIVETIREFSRLWNEIEVSRERIRQLEDIREEITNDMSVKLEEALKEKKLSEQECDRLRKREVSLETELQKLRAKIRTMETRINEDETKIRQLQSNAKNLETQLKQKDSSVDKQLKDVEKSLKNSESLLGKAETQRNIFESRLNDMKKNFSSKEKENEIRMKEMSERLVAANMELVKEREERQKKNETSQQQSSEFRLRGHEKSMDNGKSISADRAISHEEQAMNELRFSVHELTRRNEELEIALNQRQLRIEEQDRIMRERSDVMKVRDEVIELMKGNNDSRGNAESDHFSLMKKTNNNQRGREQVDKKIAENTENLQQLYTTLETKQMQITRLEQLVEQMEIQQERSQEQRTRLEKKIAQLQLAMHYKKGHRSRGWLSIL